MDLVDPTTPLPPWFTDDDLTACATLYEKSGFHLPLRVPYRAKDYTAVEQPVEAFMNILFSFGTTEQKGQLLLINGKTEDEVSRSLERVLCTMRITSSEPKILLNGCMVIAAQ